MLYHPDYDDDRNVAPKPDGPPERIVVFVLALTLGVSGVHRFYTGHYLTGLLWLFTGGLFGVGWLYDLLMIATYRFKDSQGRFLTTPWPLPAISGAEEDVVEKKDVPWAFCD